MAREAHKQPAMTRDRALARMEELAVAAHHELAGRRDAGEAVLHYLAQNGAPATRRAVAANPSAAALHQPLSRRRPGRRCPRRTGAQDRAADARPVRGTRAIIFAPSPSRRWSASPRTS
ncbi:MAG: hypothetical protein WDN03_02500 [Rhizomicrobium sp.]